MSCGCGSVFENKIRGADFALIVVIATLIIVCWHGLSGPFVFDDHPNLSTINRSTPVNYHEFIFGNSSGAFGRSISMATFALNHKLAGDFVAFDVKATNLAIHVLNGVSLYAIVIALLSTSRESESASWVALLVASLWVLTPLNTGVVFYAVQRMAMLATLFVFAGILFYFQWRLNVGGKLVRRRVYLLLAIACWPMAVLAKENGVLLPLLILTLEFGFLARGRQFKILRASLIALLVLGCVAIPILDAYAWLNYSNRSFTLIERLSTQPIVIGHYVRDLLMPLNSDIGLFNDDFPIQSSVCNTASIAASASIASVLGLCLFVKETSPFRRAAAGLLFYFGAHSVESTAIALEIYFDHRNYLPSAGLYLSAVLGTAAIVTSSAKTRFLAIALALVTVTWFAVLSYQKASAWQSWPHVVANSYTHHPRSLRAGLEMSSLLMNANNFNAALVVNENNAVHNPTRYLNIQLQKLYLYCVSGLEIPRPEYDALRGSISIGNELGNVTALEILINAKETGQCATLDLDAVIDRIADMVDISLREELLTIRQVWHLEYFVIEHARLAGRFDEVQARLRRSIDSKNPKASFYARDVLSRDWNAPVE